MSACKIDEIWIRPGYYWQSAGFDFVLKVKQAVTTGETGWGVLKTTLCYSFQILLNL